MAALSGVLLALSFPRYGHPAVAFIALVPLLVALRGWTVAAACRRLDCAASARSDRASFITPAPCTGPARRSRPSAGFPVVVAVLVAGLLALYMARTSRGFGAITAMLVRRFRVAGLWLAPAAWVAMEYLRGILIGGFPWIPLGNTMVTLLPIAQLASVVGVYGLSLFVALLNAGFAVAAISTGRRARSSARARRRPDRWSRRSGAGCGCRRTR